MLKEIISVTILAFFTVSTVFAAPSDDFIITVEIPGVSPSFVIPTNFLSAGDYDYNVDCNVADSDGLEKIGETGSSVCNYTSGGTYDIAISDNKGDGTGFPAITFNNAGDKDKLIDIKQWGTGKWQHMGFAFYGASNMVVTATDTPDFSNVTTMSAMFLDAINADPETSSWDTSEVITMHFMFSGATNADPDTRHWDTSNVIFMGSMFSRASNATPDTSNWDTSNVTDMTLMFSSSPATPDTRNWNVSQVRKMYGMFRFATAADPNTSNWDTGNVTNMREMFWGATSANPDTSNWNTSNVTDMSQMFREAPLANPNTRSWNIEAVTTMDLMFTTPLPTQYYDAMLVGFDAQNLQPDVTLVAGGSDYCGAQAARAQMVGTIASGGDGWSIEFDNLDCSQRDPIVAPDLQAASDSGLDNRDNITSDDTPTFDIACSFDIFTRIKIYTDNPVANTLIAQHICRNEIASLTSSSLPAGMHNISYVYSGLLADSAHSPALAVEISDVVLGDCTGSGGVVNINDVVCAINIVLEDGVPVRGEDVDGSGVVTITDVIAIINIVLGV